MGSIGMVTFFGKTGTAATDHSSFDLQFCRREHGTFSTFSTTFQTILGYDWDEWDRVIVNNHHIAAHLRASRCPTHCRVWWFSSMKSSYDLKVPRFWPKPHIKCGSWKPTQKNVMVCHGESWVVPVPFEWSCHIAELRCHANAFEDPRRNGSSQAGPESLPGGLGLGVGGLVVGPEWPRYCHEFKDFHGSLPAKMVSSWDFSWDS